MSVSFSDLVKNCWKEIHAQAVIRDNTVCTYTDMIKQKATISNFTYIHIHTYIHIFMQQDFYSLTITANSTLKFSSSYLHTPIH